jgi:hypothetical protein
VRAAPVVIASKAIRVISFRVGSRDLGFDKFELVGDGVKVAARLIGLTQRELMVVWHAHVKGKMVSRSLAKRSGSEADRGRRVGQRK